MIEIERLKQELIIIREKAIKADPKMQGEMIVLKQRYDDIESEKETLRQEKQNLQYQLRIVTEKLTEIETVYRQSTNGLEQVTQEMYALRQKINTMELDLQRAIKDRMLLEEQLEKANRELISRHEIITRLEEGRPRHASGETVPRPGD